MELSLLDTELQKGPPAPVWLIHGEELHLIEEAVARITHAAVGKRPDPLALTRVDLAEGKRGARDIIAACSAIGLFTPRVAVIVRAAHLLAKRPEDQAELIRYLQHPASGATLILKASEAFDGRTSFFKQLQKHAKVLSYPLLKPWAAEKWAAQRARELGHRIDTDAARFIVDLVGPSLLTLEQTLTQLSLYVGRDRPITRNDIEQALAATRAHTVFELTDAIAERNAIAAIRHIDAMLEQREYPPVLLGHLVRNLRQLVDAKAVLRAGGDASAVQNSLKVHEFVAKKLTAQAQRFDDAMLHQVFEELFRAEFELKTTRLDPALLLETLAMRLCSAGQPQGRLKRA